MNHASSWRALPVLFLLTLLVACGGDSTTGPRNGGGTAPLVEMTVGAAGGTVATPDGKVTLEIPAGAVAGDVVFTVKKAPAPSAPTLPGTAFEFGPAGTTFNEPIQLTVAYDASIAGTDPLYLGLLNETTDQIELLETTRDATAHTLSAEISHFSTYVGTACTNCTDPINLTAEWNPESKTIDLAWDNGHQRSIIVTRAAVNSPGVPPVPPNRYATLSPSSHNDQYTDYQLGQDAKIFWYWIQAETPYYVTPHSEPALVSYFGNSDPPDEIASFNARADPQDPTTMILSWQPTSTAESYELERQLPAMGWETAASQIPFSEFNWRDLNLPEDTDINYRIRGHNSAGAGPWKNATGRTSASCQFTIEYQGAELTEPIPPHSVVDLAAVNCGDAQSRTFEWWYVYEYEGGQIEEYIIGTGETIRLEVAGPTTIRLEVKVNGTRVEAISRVIAILESQVYSIVRLSNSKPRISQPFTGTMEVIDQGVYYQIMERYPEVTSIDWTIRKLENFVPVSVELTYTNPNTSSWPISPHTLAAGWYDMVGVARTASGDAFSFPRPATFEVTQ